MQMTSEREQFGLEVNEAVSALELGWVTFEGSELFVVVYYWDERCSGFAVFDDAAAKFVVVDFGVYEVVIYIPRYLAN